MAKAHFFLDSFERGILREGNPEYLRKHARINQELAGVAHSRAQDLQARNMPRQIVVGAQFAAFAVAQKARVFAGVEVLPAGVL